MPAALAERAMAFARGEGDWQVPPADPASTVILLDGANDGLVTYLMRRTSTMAFAAGMHVFPGGRVDPADLLATVRWVGDVDALRVSADETLARALLVCAVREVFEETGVLLAVDDAGRAPAEDDGWEDDRLAVLGSAHAFADVLQRRGLAIDPRLLPVWGHWVTPEVESRRYDVRFYAAVLPAGQHARDVSGEADHVRWIEPSRALSEYAAGRLMMLPPTVATLADLAGLPGAHALAEAAAVRSVRPLLPRPRLDDAGGVRWDLIDARDGSVILAMADEPAGSEVHGTRSPA